MLMFKFSEEVLVSEFYVVILINYNKILYVEAWPNTHSEGASGSPMLDECVFFFIAYIKLI